MSENQEMARKSLKKPALGRGLGSLLGEASQKTPLPSGDKKYAFQEDFADAPKTVVSPPAPQVPEHARIWQIDVTKLKPNPRQPRRIFATGALQELSASIKEKGILQPIVARPLGQGEFEIIAGERRWRAAQAAGLKDVPVLIKPTAEQEALELALIENLQREDLNPLEEAEAYSHLLKTYGLTQQQLADKIGKDRATVANTLRLLGLAPGVRTKLGTGEISMGHAKVLLTVTDHAHQLALAEKVASQLLSVRELERQVAKFTRNELAASEKTGPDLNEDKKLMRGLCEELQKIIGTRVSIEYDHGKGRIQLQFYSDAELNGIVDRLRSSWHK